MTKLIKVSAVSEMSTSPFTCSNLKDTFFTFQMDHNSHFSSSKTISFTNQFKKIY